MFPEKTQTFSQKKCHLFDLNFDIRDKHANETRKEVTKIQQSVSGKKN